MTLINSKMVLGILAPGGSTIYTLSRTFLVMVSRVGMMYPNYLLDLLMISSLLCRVMFLQRRSGEDSTNTEKW